MPDHDPYHISNDPIDDDYVPDIVSDNFVADFKLAHDFKPGDAPHYDDIEPGHGDGASTSHDYDERARAHFYAADHDLFWAELNEVHRARTGHNLDVCLGEPYCSEGRTKEGD